LWVRKLAKGFELNSLIDSVKCLIVFENKTCLLYKDLSERIESPLVRSLLLHISLDSQKHSTVLKGIAQSMNKTNSKPADLPKTMSEAWRSIDAFQIELSSIDKISGDDLLGLSEQLTTLESSLADEYSVLVQFNALDMLSRELRINHNVSLESLKAIFLEIVHDEEYHKEILSVVIEILEGKREEIIDNTPKVRFRNPDGWNRPVAVSS
jgi:rubrerythrin